MPTVAGNILSSFICFSIQSIRRLTYLGAGKCVGFLYASLSHHKYSYLGPPDMMGQDSFVQLSDTTPYNKFILLKKSTTCTAIQSFSSSSCGNFTVSLKSLPAFRVSSACLCRLYLNVPGSNFFLGLKVFEKRRRVQ
jgi:hypothetical protein